MNPDLRRLRIAEIRLQLRERLQFINRDMPWDVFERMIDSMSQSQYRSERYAIDERF